MSVTEVAKRTGATHRQIDHWIERGYLGSIGKAPGSGHSSKFSSRDIALVSIGKSLSDAGLALSYLPTIRGILSDLQDHEFEGTYLILGAGSVDLLFGHNIDDLAEYAFGGGSNAVSVLELPAVGSL